MNDREAYNEFLDESYPVVIIAGIEFSASEILKRCDPIAYDVMFSDWEDEYTDHA